MKTNLWERIKYMCLYLNPNDLETPSQNTPKPLSILFFSYSFVVVFICQAHQCGLLFSRKSVNPFVTIHTFTQSHSLLC